VCACGRESHGVTLLVVFELYRSFNYWFQLILAQYIVLGIWTLLDTWITL